MSAHPRRSLAFPLLVAAGSLLAPAALAGGVQNAKPIGASPVAAAHGSFGLGEVDGRLVGGGPGYRAEFGASGFEITAAFGAEAPRTWPLRYSLESIRRAQGPELVADLAATPALRANAIAWARSAQIEERCESRAEGVEQSFVIGARPAGAGDLVVRGAIATELAGPAVGEHATLAFTAAGLGSVEFGAVTAIDAAGRRQSCAIRWDGAHAEYVVPAAFVDSAAYPLVIDPLVVPGIVVATDYDEEEPDVAWDASNDRYLVVWQRRFSTGDFDVRGQMLNPDMTFSGGLVFIESDSGTNAVAPRVAELNASNHFVVVWTDSGFLQGSIHARTVSANTGAVSAKVDVGAISGLNGHADVGADYLEIYNDAIVTWEAFNTSTSMFEVLASRLTIAANGTISVGAPISVASGFDETNPSISSSGGPFGDYLIVWKRGFTSGDTELRGAVIARDGTIVDPLITITNNTAWEDDPAVDGDAYNFLVAYESEPTSGSGDKDVYSVRVRVVASGQYEVDPTPVNIDVGVGDSQDPDVAWLSGSALVAFRQEQLDGRYVGTIASVDALGGNICENYAALGALVSTHNRIRLGGTHDEGAMVAFESEPLAGGDDVVLAQRYKAVDGIHKYLGGGCSAAAYATCARVGNAQFGLHVTAAPASAPAYLILGAATTHVGCGAFCILTVDPSSGLFLAAGSTDAKGELEMVTGIPPSPTLVGLKFATQWLIAKPTGPWPCPSVHAFFSNGIETTLQ